MLRRVIRETVTVVLVFAFVFTSTLGNLDARAFAAENNSGDHMAINLSGFEFVTHTEY